MRLELGEGVFVRIEVGTVGRQIVELWGGGLSLEPSTIEIEWIDPPICRPPGTESPWVKSAWLSRIAGFAGTICTIAYSVPPTCTIKSAFFVRGMTNANCSKAAGGELAADGEARTSSGSCMRFSFAPTIVAQSVG
jgi:hypothetical protein